MFKVVASGYDGALAERIWVWEGLEDALWMEFCFSERTSDLSVKRTVFYGNIQGWLHSMIGRLRMMSDLLRKHIGLLCRMTD